MSQKSHQDPIIYRAYGIVRGTYQPSRENLKKGTLTSDDGTSFRATLVDERAIAVFADGQEPFQPLVWRCYFRTKPSSLQLSQPKRDGCRRYGNLRVNQFRVDGEVTQVKGETVSVRVKRNVGKGRAFTLTLKGRFDYEPEHRFWRFKVLRDGKSYRILTARKLGVPQPPEPKAVLG